MWALVLLSLAAAPDPGALLDRARALYEELRYDDVLPVVDQILSAPETTVEQRVDAHILKGSCLAILGRTLDAETSFRLSLRARPGLELPEDTPPKILTIFKKVKLEEDELSRQLEALERERLIKTLVLEGGPVGERGGRPLRFDFALADPNGAVDAVRVSYRRAGEPDFSSVALQRDGPRWAGEIPGEWTANEGGLVVEFFVTTHRRDGARLLRLGSPSAPRAHALTPGAAVVERPLLASPWFWGVAASALAVAATAVGAGVYLVTAPPPTGLGVVDADPP